MSLGNRVLRASQREPRFGTCSPAPHCVCDPICVTFFFFFESPVLLSAWLENNFSPIIDKYFEKSD